MLRTATRTPTVDVPDLLRRVGAWLRRTWHQPRVDDDERFLREARDIADLERRLQQLERGPTPRFGPLPPGL